MGGRFFAGVWTVGYVSDKSLWFRRPSALEGVVTKGGCRV